MDGPTRSCPACGVENPRTERVCAECGSWTTEPTKVVFRVLPVDSIYVDERGVRRSRVEPDIVALIPEVPWGCGRNFCIGHFAWSGGHVETHYAKTMRKSRAATEDEYRYLKGLLEESFGYRFLVVTRATPAMTRLRIRRADANL